MSGFLYRLGVSVKNCGELLIRIPVIGLFSWPVIYIGKAIRKIAML
jgi:hypothetical protein